MAGFFEFKVIGLEELQEAISRETARQIKSQIEKTINDAAISFFNSLSEKYRSELSSGTAWNELYKDIANISDSISLNKTRNGYTINFSNDRNNLLASEIENGKIIEIDENTRKELAANGIKIDENSRYFVLPAHPIWAKVESETKISFIKNIFNSLKRIFP